MNRVTSSPTPQGSRVVEPPSGERVQLTAQLSGLSLPGEPAPSDARISLEGLPAEIQKATEFLERFDYSSLPPAVNFLQDYQGVLPERKTILASSLEERISVYASEKLETAEDAFDRIAGCGPFLKGLTPELIAALRDGRCGTLDGFPVRHGIPLMARLGGGRNYDIHGATTKFLRGINHSDPFPSLNETLHHIARHRALPEVVTVIAHEQTHLKHETAGRWIAQWGSVSTAAASLVASLAVFSPSSILAMCSSAALLSVPILLSYAKVLSPFNRALEEVQAGIIEKSLYSIKDPHNAIDLERRRLSEVISADHKELVEKYADGIRHLHLLNDDTDALHSLVEEATYDPKTKTFPTLDLALAAARRERGLQDDRLYQTVIAGLEARDTIERAVFQKEAQAIAQLYFDKRSEKGHGDRQA